MQNADGSTRPARVFVFLGEGFGASRWRSQWNNGNVPGICDQLPYGYFHAANESWSVTYSEDREESRPFQLLRRALRKVLGFDLIHAWHNRETLSTSDVVWTHTEREYLAALCLWRLRPPKARPKLIAQSVWLFDRWRRFSALRRALYRRLIRGADVLTALSPDNLFEARKLFPDKRCELVRFGIDAASLRPAHRRRLHRPIRILSLGSDMHRDWDTLIEAVRGWDEGVVQIASKTIRQSRSLPANVEVMRPGTAQAVRDLYDWADLVAVTLKPNLHASGITVVAEAVLFGLPVICTDTGGLRAYFGDHEVSYVAPQDPRALRLKIEELAADEDLRFGLAVRAQCKISQDELTSYGYAIRHRELSESLLHLPARLPNEKSARAMNGAIGSRRQAAQ
jgi:glycosyltransferase involved in cell wall biosynthesis